MKPVNFRRLCFATAISLVATCLSAQTQKTAQHHARNHVRHRPAAARTSQPACAVLSELSPKIPALPPGTPCARPLYTLTRMPQLKLDYVSPLVSPTAREGISTGPETYSLDYVDITTGSGELVQTGKYLSVKYTGWLADGSKFDSSDDHPGKEPITFPYGEHHVIEGWDTGFEGMHVGGKRRLYIPYELAYGERGRPPVIPAKAMLVFDMELVSMGDTQPAPRPPAVAPRSPAAKPSAPTPPSTSSGAPAPKRSGASAATPPTHPQH